MWGKNGGVTVKTFGKASAVSSAELLSAKSWANTLIIFLEMQSNFSKDEHFYYFVHFLLDKPSSLF